MFESIEFHVGQEIDLDQTARRLSGFGYTRQARLAAPAEFAVRGGLLDVHPPDLTLPVRVTLSDRTIESIHAYDPETGRPVETHRMVVVLPVRGAHKLKTRSGEWALAGLDKPIDPYVDIEPGQRVVHVLHGIARYRGMKKLQNARGADEDHLTLEFADRRILYVPSRDLHLVQRYVAFGRMRPPLSRLGSRQWERLKDRTRRGVASFAAELLHLQAQRKTLEGFKAAPDGEWQRRLEEEFPYEETADQTRTISEVKRDLESSLPMDRLICGDVGYGKTEVALRAAFKVVLSGRQVAVLVPTTLLAEQHYQTFTARMKSFPVSVRMLSRFCTASEQARTVESLRDGSCDVVIGTHRLLSKDVAFKELGLVIIDEEQRFGVRHKERLKQMRLLVDVLTLTATPIPRTLYLALVGARDLSTIQTPPRQRRPVETVVAEPRDEVIRGAIERELARGGQVFVVHDRVRGIDALARRVGALAPGARVAVGHGQLPAKELESVMLRFIRGQIDVLVSTTIVESGIDIPNANTILIHHADRFGLSELYQLRGRVGRFDRDAHAILLVSRGGAGLSEESQRRLAALQRFAHLGAGFNVAMEDLEIRGAGDILGTEQHGYITGIGFDLYCRILREAVDALKGPGSGATGPGRDKLSV